MILVIGDPGCASRGVELHEDEGGHAISQVHYGPWKYPRQAGTHGDWVKRRLVMTRPRASARLCRRWIAEATSKSIPPARPNQIHAEGSLGLGVRGATHIGHEHDRVADHETGDPGWDPAWRFGAERLRQGGQPLRHASRIVIDDVINPRRPARDRGTREAGGVVDVSERPNAATAANDRDAPLANIVHHPALFAYGGSGTIERPVAQDQPLQNGLASDRGSQIADRFKRAAQSRRRLWIERVFLCLYRASRSRIRPTRKALRDEPSHPGRPRSGQQIIRTLRA